MVPYVRKSFFKHYVSEYYKTLDEFYELDLFNMTEEEFDAWCDEHKEELLEMLNLSKEDFRFDNIGNLDRCLSQAAIYETRKEIYQAVEGMYHNLNTLQSRSGNQLKWWLAA